MGIVHGIRAFVPGMLAHGEEAHIVNTASMSGLVTFGGGGAYGASKHAAVTVSELLYLELRERRARIGVSVLCPAWVRTRILDSERNLPERLRETNSDGPDDEMYAAMTASMAATGLDADVVAGDAVDAILNDRFYVLSNPEWAEAVTERAAAVRRGDPPVPPRSSA
jgi:NAD(P)-dependent dehydrogenase (short-subunit alcohol dehydrogenase family)